jgi:colanic acid/amylovoran biosynthesis glycosyltransferase
MGYPLAVFSSWIGVPSETFIRRHMNELLPGGAVVVAWDDHCRQGDGWGVDGPLLLLNSLPRRGLGRRVIAAAARGLGWKAPPRGDAVKRFVLEHQVKVVLAEYLHYGVVWMEFTRDLGLKFFAHAHGHDVSRLLRERKWRRAYRQYNQADGVITVSRFSAARLASVGVASSKIHVIPCGVHVRDEPVVRPLGEKIRCIAVGRMVRKKAPLLTLEAFRRASTSCASLHLDYVGGGDLLPAAQQFVRDYDLANRVKLHGTQPNEMVQRLMRDSDIFLQHSITDPETGDEEGLPVAILEAMAQSLPIVSTRHAGIPEAVDEGVTGYLVDEGDSTAMAERLIALSQKPAQRQTMGRAGWQKAKEVFSWEKERTDLLDLLGLS